MNNPKIRLYPFFAALAPIWLYYNTQAAQEIPIDQLAVPSLAAVLATFVIYAIFAGLFLLVLQKKEESEKENALIAVSVIISIGWLLFYSLAFCVVINGIFEVAKIPVNFIGYAPLVLPVFWLVMIVMAVASCFKKAWLIKFDSAFKFIFLFFIITQTGALGWNYFQDELVTASAVNKIQTEEIIKPIVDTINTNDSVDKNLVKKPDIYYIVLDEMAGIEALSKYLNYDDEWFYKALEKRGFFVARKSNSNYPLTRLSISSSLNMTYIDSFSAQFGNQKKNWCLTTPLMRNNAVAKILKKQGYKYVFVDSGVPPTTRSEIADTVLNCGLTDQFSEKLLHLTILGVLPQTNEFITQLQRERVHQEFKYLQEQPLKRNKDNSNPNFVFSHILCPHEPFIFGSKGEPVFIQGSRCDSHWTDDTKAAYLAQAEFVQKKALVSIDAIVKNDPQAIIVLQGDHGTHCSDTLYASSHPRDELLHERYSILNAYRVPDQIKSGLSDTIQPVNSFRLILSRLFGYKIEPLAEKQYYSNYSQPFNCTDVTDTSASARCMSNMITHSR